MKLDKLPFNAFDVFLLVWLTMGILRGRKRGMSEELMTLLQWIVIVIAGAFAYQPLGSWMHHTMNLFGLLVSYLVAYLLIAGVVALVFVTIKRTIGGKLIGSDAFGKAEYYLGMPAGMLRFVCMLFAALAILNARLYSQAEIAAMQKFQMENYGSEFFPGLQELQVTVFEKSIAGPPIHKFLSFLLITPTAPAGDKYRQKDWGGQP